MIDNPNFPKMYNTDEVSKILCVHKATALKLMSEGSIKSKKIGRSWMATEEAIKDYMTGSK